MGFRTIIEIIQEQKFSTHVFWKLYASFEFRKQMMLEALDFASVTLEETRDEGSRRFNRMSAVPNFALPHALTQIVGPRFGYVEEGTFDATARRYTYRIVPTALAERVSLVGTIEAADLEGGRCVCTIKLEQASEMTGLGGLLERLMARTTKRNMQLAWERMAPYMDEHGVAWFERLPEVQRNVLP